MPSDTKKPAKPASSPVKNGYLILYNAVSAILWLTVLGRVVGANVLKGHQLAYPAVGEFCKWTQTLAGMEVLHSLLGTCPAFTSGETEEDEPEMGGGFYITVES